MTQLQMKTSKFLTPVSQEPIALPALDKQKLDDVFISKSELFGAVDANIKSWLSNNVESSKETKVSSYELTVPLNNDELVVSIGGMEEIKKHHIFTFTQITSLVEDGTLLQRNGFQNLFFVQNKDQLYLLGVVFDKAIDKWVPYIYRLRNLYRSWSKGNRLFLR